MNRELRETVARDRDLLLSTMAFVSPICSYAIPTSFKRELSERRLHFERCGRMISSGWATTPFYLAATTVLRSTPARPPFRLHKRRHNVQPEQEGPKTTDPSSLSLSPSRSGFSLSPSAGGEGEDNPKIIF